MANKKRLAIDIDESVHEQLKIHSIKAKRTMSEIVSELITQYLEEHTGSDKGKDEKDEGKG